MAALTIDEQRALLQLARTALEARVCGLALPRPAACAQWTHSSGAFVTAHCRGELRGCLGHLDPADTLVATVQHLAAAVADSDPRFRPLRAEELPHVALEISVLTPGREIASLEEIEPGRHGLIVEHGHRRGLLLPQVAIEHGWGRTQFLEHTCRKAGLPLDAWRHGARIFVFEAQVFGEEGALTPSTT